jgi:hypothetical protein
MKTINQSNVSPFASLFSKNHAKQVVGAEILPARVVKILERRLFAKKRHY